MRAARLPIVLALVIAYALLGVGYHRLEGACYESRHSLDKEPRVYGGVIGVAFDMLLWPVGLAADGINGSDCEPQPS